MQIAVVWAFSYCQRYCGWRSVNAAYAHAQLPEQDGLSINRNHIGRKKKQITLFSLPNDFWHLLNRTLQAVSLLTTSTPVLLVTRPSGHHLVNSLQPPVVRCYSPSWQWSRAIHTEPVCWMWEVCVGPRLCVCVCVIIRQRATVMSHAESDLLCMPAGWLS